MAGIAFTNMYNSVVDTRSWISHVPDSIVVFRAYFREVNPGNFFRLFSPLNQLLSLVVVVLFWKTSLKVRYLLIAAFLMAVVGDLITFVYFYPRNDMLMHLPIDGNTDTFLTILKQWRLVNWVRTLIILTGLACAWMGLFQILQPPDTGTPRPASR